ncbi:hypothetical protein [Photobacterium satsumensis]|uniref:hypothetical protein n=1 Tax=Photobacterium satsumensis TaxID=2910239 RepID=UPI003D12158E
MAVPNFSKRNLVKNRIVKFYIKNSHTGKNLGEIRALVYLLTKPVGTPSIYPAHQAMMIFAEKAQT